MIIERIGYSLLFIVLGTVSLKYNFQLVNNTFRLEWVESKLGSGSTYLVYKLISILMVLGGIMYLVYGNAMFGVILSPLLSLFPHS